MDASPLQPALTVGIGASAGGVEAIEQFFDRMPGDSGLAFVVVQHLSPDFKSLMDEILRRHTTMPVQVAVDGMLVAPNHVYVNPPGKVLGIRDGRLTATDRDVGSSNVHPIDVFFRELAANAPNKKSAAIILSGTGSDGAEGIAEIKKVGGFVLAQEPASAQFDGMPRAALATGHVDMTLSPEQMPPMLLSLVFQDAVGVTDGPHLPALHLDKILSLLRETYGADFRAYKVPTLARRTERRMRAVGAADTNEYYSILSADPAELDVLYRELLIGVTQFFRDGEAFARLSAVWLPDLLKRLPPEEEFRAWVAGCATGEEAYSVAMIVRESLEALGRSNPVKIFATDIHRDALRHAALGLFDERAIADLGATRRERFFVKRDDGTYQVSTTLRAMVVFAPHNVAQDVPFNRLDFISCRNLLIYLEPSAQKRVLSTFHFALRPGGLLFLGPSESLAESGEAFETLDTHWKIFRRRGDARLPAFMPPAHGPVLRARMLGPGTPTRAIDPTLLGAYHGVLDAVMPAALLVGSHRNLVQTFGGASRFLHVPEGRATDNVLEMVSSDLRGALGGALSRVFTETEPVRYRDLRTGTSPDTLLDISVRRVTNARSGEVYALVTLETQRPAPHDDAPSSMNAPVAEVERNQVRSLQAELRHAKDSLQATIEALEVANEELQATNEELMASNEELQTTNEELHSVNQELFTVNTEFQNKISELTQLTLDMDLLLANTDVHTLFLDKELRIRRFTPRMAKVFHLVASDVGRPISAFNHTFKRPELHDDLHRVLTTGEPIEAQVRDDDDAWALIRILPYRRDALLDGVVLTFIDITAMKRLEADARSKSDLLSNILMNSPHPVFVRDREGRYVVTDESFRRLASRDPTGLKPEQIFSVDVAAMLTRHDASIVEEGVTIETEETIPTPSGPRTYLSVRFPMRDSSGSILGIGGIQTDVTTLKRAETEARDATSRRDRFLATLSHELRNPLAAIVNAARVVTRGSLDGDEIARWNGVILERSLHMSRLVDDLLDVARLTQDKLTLERTPLDLVTHAKGVVDEVAALFAERGITLTTDFCDTLPLVGDATRLHQLEVNLLTNAARHTPRGGHAVFALRHQNGWAEISVADSGEGIAPDMLERIFDLFVQGHAPGSRGTERGLGVGLALVRRVAELHGGSVSVASKGLGTGAEFRVRIPLDARDVKAMAAPSRPDATPSVVPRTVVVVDDDEGSREAMSKLLELEGAEVSVAAHGEEALSLLANRPPPDLVLLDIGLPGMDGHEVCRRLRALPNGKDFIVFALTGFGQDSDREATRKSGFDGHLTKPVDVDAVFALYARVASA